MKFERKVVDEKKKIVQITTSDERWYFMEDKGVYVPSSTWICSYYPKGYAYMKWLADKGMSEAESLRDAAGDRGRKIHNTIAMLLAGEEISHNLKVLNHETDEYEELTAEEYAAVLSFFNWMNDCKAELISSEKTLWNEEYGYAGTMDLKVKLDNVILLVDMKTSKSIYPSHRIQLSSYLHCPENKDVNAQAILQVGYQRNKIGYKLTPIDDCFDLFLSTKKIWSEETKEIQPFQKDYPLSITFKKEK